MTFQKEADFENSLITLLFEKGWERSVIKNPSEQDLLKNWAAILFDNNREIDRLNNQPLTSGEMEQIIEQIRTLRTPLKLNGFINGKTVSVKRDNPDDILHLGKEISLKIYDRQEIAAGQSRYQIVQQPKFPTHGIFNDRRGDIMLLINGMPVFHIELKKSGIPVSQAAHQIEKYSREGIFRGLFALVQIFVAMEPNETLYFANPGPEGKFNQDFYFHWANFDNEPMNDWKDIASTLLSIPMAHQMIGFYTVPDDTDGILKVMRSYQYYAASRISDQVTKTKWQEHNQLGGYIWHTTGSGKTMTSFKSAQLIANSKDADKVVFLMDRIELGTQSLKEYRGFADEGDVVQQTEDTQVLRARLTSDLDSDTLIVTSIQKMSRIKEEGELNAADFQKMAKKRIVFIVDECHRSTFGDMLITVKKTFPSAIFFGFTGTPIHDENQIKGNTTTTVFGNELHRYSIADGIRDKNVLGFDPYQVCTYRDADLRKVVALQEAKADSVAAAIADPAKKAVYYRFMDKSKVGMVGSIDKLGKYQKGIEDYLQTAQYKRDEHHFMVVKDICENWLTLSRDGKFHAIFATSSIPEAITYYRLIKEQKPDLKITALFDPNIDNGDGTTSATKQSGLVEIMEDYNKRYGQTFDFGAHAKFKKDLAARLSHKAPYQRIEVEAEKQLDLLIVVDQMLTGFDSKWVNTLYLDKLLEYHDIIQAFSRTNRLFGPDKPFGTIRYYRKPHTMRKNIEEAVKLYSGDKPIGLFVQRLKENLDAMNMFYHDIEKLFQNAGVKDFKKNPDDQTACAMFAKLFKSLNDHMEAAKIQGFQWGKEIFEIQEKPGAKKESVKIDFEETTYNILLQRYKELFSQSPNENSKESVAFEIDGYLIQMDTARIDADYMNSRFEKYMKLMNLNPKPSPKLIKEALDDLHKSFASLTQEDQKYANIFLHDIQSGEASLFEGYSLRDNITEYKVKAQEDRIDRISVALGLNEALLREMMVLKVTEANINEYGRFEKLRATVDKAKASSFFEKQNGTKLPPPKLNIKIDELLRRFLLEENFDIS
ncbi:MAG: HsdR family type I site-specific deoxyribonuclease [Lachnospiraceae bacterium]|jgi:type I restriction enzyme R subunit|nr:HsdR family type I site-specific deoxyribonuclease [Lachnospiraceae bacterium]